MTILTKVMKIEEPMVEKSEIKKRVLVDDLNPNPLKKIMVDTSSNTIEAVVYSNSEETRNNIRKNLEDYGMCIVDNVLNSKQVEKALNLTWVSKIVCYFYLNI